MEERGTLSRHFWLSRGMARAAGADLTRARRDGRLSEEALAHLIARCSACGRARECTAWLAVNGAGPADPPEWCAISEALRALARGETPE